MDANRFDRLTRKVAHRVSRRGAFGAGGLGLGAVMLGHFGPATLAQQATPVVEATPVASGEVEVLFVQTFGSGTFVPDVASEGDYTLTLENGTGQTTYFSDRPDRVVGTLSDEQFLDGRAFDSADPANAAIVAQAGDNQDTLIVELFDPSLDSASGTVSYTARLLDGQPQGAALASLAARQADNAVDAEFGPVSLFIDQLSCGPDGASCDSNSDCCSGTCCEDNTFCPLGTCVS